MSDSAVGRVPVYEATLVVRTPAAGALKPRRESDGQVGRRSGLPFFACALYENGAVPAFAAFQPIDANNAYASRFCRAWAGDYFAGPSPRPMAEAAP